MVGRRLVRRDHPERVPGLPQQRRPQEERQPTLTGTHIELDDSISFVLGQARFLAKCEPLPDAIAGAPGGEPQVTRVRVAGHTDDQGPAPFKLELSERRARAVVDALVAAASPPSA